MKNSIRFISFLLVILLALTSLPSNISAESDSGEILRELGILKGDLSGDLLLDQPLKRQDAVVLLSRLLGEEETAENYPRNPSFTDIADPYYIPFIAWAEDNGLTEGVGNGLFGFDEFLTNQQLMAFLLRSLGYEFYGAQYGLVPGKALELDLSPAGEKWDDSTTRQIMADRTVSILRIGRIKASNVTLERSLATSGTNLPDNGQLFQLIDFEYRKGLVVATFKAPAAQDYNSSRSNTTAAILYEGPDVDDIRVTVEKDESGEPIVLELEKQFYDSTTGVLLASFEHPEVPDDSTVEVRANYLEDRELIAHEAAHVVQQKSPGTYEPGEILLMLEEILGDILQTGTGNFTGGQFNDDELDKLEGLSTNPLYEENSSSGTNPLYEEEGSISGGSGDITFLENVSSFVPENLFAIVLHDGEEVETVEVSRSDYIRKNMTVTLKNIDVDKDGRLEIIFAYINGDHMADQYARNYGFKVEVVNSIISDLIINLHKASRLDTLTSTYNFGRLTVHVDRIEFRGHVTVLKAMQGVIVGTERTNPELDDEVIIALATESGEPDLRTYKVTDFGNRFRNDEDAYNYFSRYLDPDDDGDGLETAWLDPDSDGDGLDDVVFTKDKKPVRVIKPIDKASPLLYAADGGLGDNVTLYLQNGKVMFWTNGDEDCDDDDREVFPTRTYIDTIEIDKATPLLRTGRNPQTGKEIKIAAKTPIVIDHDDGSVSVSTIKEPDSLLLEQSSFPYARVVTDENDNALFIHIIQDALVVHIETKELDKSSPKIMFTNIDDLTEEEIDFLLSDEHEIETFVFRQELGQVQSSSARVYNKRKFAEIILEDREEELKKGGPRFKAGAELSKKVNIATDGSDGEDNDCDLVIIGDPPNLDGAVDFSEVPEGTEAVMVVDSFFDIFTELSVEFRGHVTVLK